MCLHVCTQLCIVCTYGALLSLIYMAIFTGMMDRFLIQKYYQDSRTRTADRLTSNCYELRYLHGKARKMWYLAYTLINNPGLVELRRRCKGRKKSASKLTIPVTSKNSHISDFAIANELAMDDFEMNAVVNKQTVIGFEMETVEPDEKSDRGFKVEAVVNELAIQNENGIKVEAAVNIPAETNENDFDHEVKENS